MKNQCKMTAIVAAYSVFMMVHAKAAVILTFQQVGPNVTATWGGQYDLPPTDLMDYDPSDTGSWINFGPSAVAVITFGLGADYDFKLNHGTPFDSGLQTIPPDSYVGDNFGFSFGDLLWPTGVSGMYMPSGVMTFNDITLSDLGASNFNQFVAFRGDGSVNGSREIRFQTVPEASIALLNGLGALALLRRRRLD